MQIGVLARYGVPAIIFALCESYTTTGFFQMLARADDSAPVVFGRLAEPDQLSYLQESLTSFRERTSNISAVANYSVRNLECNPATRKAGNKILDAGRKTNYEVRRIRHSHRVAVNSELVRQPMDTPRPSVGIEGYDAAKGESRIFETINREGNDSLKFGRITPEKGPVAVDCFFCQYLGADAQSLADLGGWFLRNIEKAAVDHFDNKSGVVEVGFPDSTPGADKSSRTRVLFDLKHDALPIGLRIDRITVSDDGAKEEYSYHLDFGEPVQVDGVWVPTKMNGKAWSSDYPRQITIHEGSIGNIALGRVRTQDLQVEFPPGTDVGDDFNGTRFKIAPDGTRIASTIYQAPTEGNAKGGASYSHVITWLLGLVTLALLAAVVHRHARLHRVVPS